MKSIMLAFALGVVPVAARAHEGGHDVRGVVVSAGAQELTVKTSRGSEKFVVTADTEFVKDGAPATAQDLKASARVVVHAKRRSGRMEAVKVEFSSALSPRKQR